MWASFWLVLTLNQSRCRFLRVILGISEKISLDPGHSNILSQIVYFWSYTINDICRQHLIPDSKKIGFQILIKIWTIIQSCCRRIDWRKFVPSCRLWISEYVSIWYRWFHKYWHKIQSHSNNDHAQGYVWSLWLDRQ